MIDKEMAEEYSKSACAWIEDREPLDERDIQQAFLAGLKTGRPQWHYPSKGEYPEKGKEVLLYTKILGLIFGEFCEGYNNLWTSNRCDFTTEEIIAWIEKEKILPKEIE